MEADSPMGRMRSDHKPIPIGLHERGEVSKGKITEGTDVQAFSNSPSELPHSGSYMISVGREGAWPERSRQKQGWTLATSEATVAYLTLV